MIHSVEIVEEKKLSDGQFAVSVQCCGDKIHVSWLTVDASLILDPERFEATLDGHCARVASYHQAAIDAKEVLGRQIGTVRKHQVQGQENNVTASV